MALLHRIQLVFRKVTTINPSTVNAYTVAAGYRVVVKTVTVRNLDSSSSRTVYWYTNGLLVWSAILAAGGAAGSFLELDTDVVLHPGDTIDLAISGGTAGTTFTISGSIYSI